MQVCQSPRKWRVLKECVIEHEFYEKGDVYYETHLGGDKTYLNVLEKHEFIKLIPTHNIKIVESFDSTPVVIHLKGYNIHIKPE